MTQRKTRQVDKEIPYDPASGDHSFYSFERAVRLASHLATQDGRRRQVQWRSNMWFKKGLWIVQVVR